MSVNTPAISPADAFHGSIAPAKTSLFYQLGLTVVAFAMVLLPLVYVALVVAMGKLVWWHLTNDTGIFEHASGRAIIIALVLYLGPAIAGVIFVAFLVKPLFSRQANSGPPLKLEAAKEPQLFAFIGKICDTVGAPRPREVRVDCQVNASASFRRGWLSFFGNDLVLTIGMPLAAGMTMRQLAGVLAHEFGHFAQGAGMRLTFIIRSVNIWFARVVYERDSWDEWLQGWAATNDWRIQIIFKLAQGGVWLGRKVLWVLMQAGHAISCFMARQMEYDADSYEAKVAGSDEFARTSGRLRHLSAGQVEAINDAYSTWQHRELPDDLPAMVAWRTTALSADIRQKLDASEDAQKTHWASTHPCDRDRIRAAEALAAPGIFHLERPASDLFSDFAGLSKLATRHFYEHDQELTLTKVNLRASAEIMTERKAADEAGKAAEVFFGPSLALHRIKPLPDAAASRWQEARRSMKEGAAEYEALLKQHGAASARLVNQRIGLSLLEAGFTLSEASQFDLVDSGLNHAQADVARSVEAVRNLDRQMTPFESAASLRMAAALRWLDDEAGDDQHTQARRHALIHAQRLLAEALKHGSPMREACGALNLIFANAGSHNDGQRLERHAKELAARCEGSLSAVLQILGDVEHPFMPAGTLLRDSLRSAEPGDNEYVRAFKASDVCNEALVILFSRIIGELCAYATKAEETLEQAVH